MYYIIYTVSDINNTAFSVHMLYMYYVNIGMCIYEYTYIYTCLI